MPDQPVVPPAVAAPPVLEAQTSMAARLSELFPTGVMPEAVALRPGEAGSRTPAPGESSSGPAATGATGPAESGATGPAESGATGPAATGATGPAESGATGPALTPEQLDAASKAMTPQAGTAFKVVRADLSAERAAHEATKAELAKVQAAADAATSKVDEKEVAALRKQVEDYENALAVTDVQSTASFKKDIEAPLKKANADLSGLAVKYKISEGDIRAALSDPDEAVRTDKLAELSADFNRLDVIKFDRAITEAQRLEAARVEALAGATEKSKAAQAQRSVESRQAAEAFQTSWKTALDASFTKLATDLPIFAPTGDTEWDKSIAAVHSTVTSRDVAKMSNDELASEMYKAGVFPLLLQMVTDLQSDKTSLDEQLTKLRGGTPPAGGGAGTVSPPAQTGPVIDDKTSFADIARQKLSGILPP